MIRLLVPSGRTKVEPTISALKKSLDAVIVVPLVVPTVINWNVESIISGDREVSSVAATELFTEVIRALKPFGNRTVFYTICASKKASEVLMAVPPTLPLTGNECLIESIVGPNGFGVFCKLQSKVRSDSSKELR